MNIKYKVLIIIICGQFTADAQNWSPWSSVQANNEYAVQYSYRLSPVSTGNSFSLKIRNGSLSNLCGDFKVNLNMINGAKSMSYSFKDLKPDVEKSCPGVYQFGDVESFVSITNTDIGICGSGLGSDIKLHASFTIDYHNDASKGGRFKFIDPRGQYSFEASASSGHLNAANQPVTQQFKNMGTIPSGTWVISEIKDAKKMILRLTPSSNVVNPNNRNGFLIHGYNTDPADASVGCIILEGKYREKLMKAFLRDGKVELEIKNKVY